MFDLVILGSGSAAFAAAIKAADHGAKTAMIERSTVGGTCVNVGCVPSKNLLRAGELRYYDSHREFPGIGPEGKPPNSIGSSDRKIKSLGD